MKQVRLWLSIVVCVVGFGSAAFAGNLSLVKQTQNGKRVVMDDTGLLWGDVRHEIMTWEKAKKACNTVTEAEGFMSNKKWRLPTPEELAHIGRKDQSQTYFEEKFHKGIQGNEMYKIIPNMNRYLWSSSAVGLIFYYAWGFNGYNGYVYDGYRDYGVNFVRCVAR